MKVGGTRRLSVPPNQGYVMQYLLDYVCSFDFLLVTMQLWISWCPAHNPTKLKTDL